MIQDFWKLLLDEQNREALKIVGYVVAALAAAGWALYQYFFKRSSETSTRPGISADHGGIAAEKITATTHPGGTTIITTGPVTINADEAAKELINFYKKQLEISQEQTKALTEAIKSIPKQTQIVNAKARIEAALKAIKNNDTGAAEAIFQEVLDQKAAEGLSANSQAAEAARHLGALVFLHNTEKALEVYGRAVSLDPENPDGWNNLGHLRSRTGDLSGAEEAYRKVLNRGEILDDQAWQAAANTNLGVVYQTRGELDQAEEMYQKSLKINEALGHKEGMAGNYTNLGNIYQTQGELDQAEKMHEKSLKINEALDHKEGMASDYTNLGIIYQTRGDLDRAEQMYQKSLTISEALGHKEGMARNYGNLGVIYQTRGDLDRAEQIYRKSLTLFTALGNPQMIEKVQGLLDDLDSKKKG